MKKITVIQLFLGLIDAQQAGVITDTLWMGGKGSETIWEALIAEISELDYCGNAKLESYNGDDSRLKEILLSLLSQEESKNE